MKRILNIKSYEIFISDVMSCKNTFLKLFLAKSLNSNANFKCHRIQYIFLKYFKLSHQRNIIVVVSETLLSSQMLFNICKVMGIFGVAIHTTIIVSQQVLVLIKGQKPFSVYLSLKNKFQLQNSFYYRIIASVFKRSLLYVKQYNAIRQ